MATTPDASDLVNRLLAASTETERAEAWDELIKACEPQLRGVLGTFSRSRPPQDDGGYGDLVTDLYVHLSCCNWRRLRQYSRRPNATFCNWIGTVARRLLQDKHRRQPPPTVSIDDCAGEGCDPFAETLPDPGPTPEEACVFSDLRRIILEEIARLRDPDCPEIILRHVLSDHPQQLQRIAAQMRMTPANVRQKYHRNLEALSKSLPRDLLGKP